MTQPLETVSQAGAGNAGTDNSFKSQRDRFISVEGQGKLKLTGWLLNGGGEQQGKLCTKS